MNNRLMQAFVSEIVKQTGRKMPVNHIHGPTDKWYSKFRKRNNLSLRKPEPLKKQRAAVSRGKIVEHFDLLEKVIEDVLGNMPEEELLSRLFNMYETSWSRDQQQVWLTYMIMIKT